MVELKTESEIEAMSAAGAVVAEALRAVVEHAAPGCSTAALDKVAADVLARHSAGSPFLNYHPRWAPSPFRAVSARRCTDGAAMRRAASSWGRHAPPRTPC